MHPCREYWGQDVAYGSLVTGERLRPQSRNNATGGAKSHQKTKAAPGRKPKQTQITTAAEHKLPIKIFDELTEEVIESSGMLDLASGEIFDVRLLGTQLGDKGEPVLRVASAGAIVQLAAQDPSQLSAQSFGWARSALQDRNALVRQAAALALADSSSAEAVPLLVGSR